MSRVDAPIFMRSLLKPTLLLFLILAPAALHAAPNRVQQPLTVKEVPSLRGYPGERWEANRVGSLHGFDIDKYTRLVEQRNHRDW